jgi:hypothetical protein
MFWCLDDRNRKEFNENENILEKSVDGISRKNKNRTGLIA